jgi:beta-glucanase (GH16 family)
MRLSPDRRSSRKSCFVLKLALFALPALALNASPAFSLAFTSAVLNIAQNTCISSSPVVVTDVTGKQTPVTSNETMTVDQGPTSLTFYKDTACTQKTSAFTLASGSSSLTFYMRGTAVGTFLIRAQVPGLLAAWQVDTVSPASNNGFQNPPTTPPAQASAAGYRKLVFYDEFNSAANISPDGSGSYNWYTTNFYSPSATLPNTGYQVGNGYLTILTDASGYSEGLATAEPAHSSGVWQHGYFESRIRFNPLGSQGGAWPAFWSYSIEGAMGQIPAGSDFAELDFMECYPIGGSCTFITTLHQWQYNPSGNISIAGNPNNVPTIPAGTDFTQWHIYGCLWTPNKVQWYLDNKLITTVATGPGTNFTALEQNHMFLLLGTGMNWPMDVDYVHVWQ